ncbi:MAG: sodium:solute symporter family protein [Clostridiales Family XIII bacterium]|jgi:SSS family solute:Na+ symporter|nr:sodium:solute symporter family protein [Clostridiales Family XIII bacterium]
MVQIIIIVIYFALTVAIGMWSMKKSKTSDSFHGAELSVAAIVCASAGEWLGGTSTTGVSEYGFNFGLSGSWYTISNGIGVMFLALCFAKLYRSLNSVTVPGIIESFFGVKARTVSSVLLTIVMLAVGLSQMIAAGKLGQSLLGFDFRWTVIGFAIIFIVYTLAGGMNAVASTNQMHLFVMYGGVILAIVFALMKVNGWGAFTEGIAAVAVAEDKASYFNMIAIGPTKVSSWIIASLLGACTAQAGIQPVLAAKDVPTARKACIITAFVAAPFGLFTAILGMVAKVMSSKGDLLDTAGVNVTDAKMALPTLMMNLPPVVGGLVLASILAAILSTVSPIILAAGTMITKDLYQRVLRPESTDAQVLFMSRLTTALSGVVCSVGAIALVNMTAVLDVVYSAYSLRGAMFIVVLLGIYWRKASEKAACQSMVLTGIVAVVWVVIRMSTGHYPISDTLTETYAAVIVAFIATVILSYVFPKTQAEIDRRKAV